MPAVSISVSGRPSTTSGVSMASRVVPASSETIARGSPRMRLTSDDLPTFGRPITARRISPWRSCSIASTSSFEAQPRFGQQIAGAEPLRGGYRHRLPEPEAVKLGRQRHLGYAIDLVGPAGRVSGTRSSSAMSSSPGRSPARDPPPATRAVRRQGRRGPGRGSSPTVDRHPESRFPRCRSAKTAGRSTRTRSRCGHA